MVWLDAHWSGGTTGGADIECPLLEELYSVSKSNHDHCILIDNMSMFLRPPPKPHDPDKWPNIREVLASLPVGYYTVIKGDNLIAIPDAARSFLMDYLREHP